MRPDVERIVAYASGAGHDVSEGNEATRIVVAAQHPAQVEVLVPWNCLEWFVTVRDLEAKEQLHTDWCDHYPTDGEDEATLAREHAEAVIRFIEAVSGAALRVTSAAGVRIFGRQFFRTKQLEVSRNGESWREVWETMPGPDEVGR